MEKEVAYYSEYYDFEQKKWIKVPHYKGPNIISWLGRSVLNNRNDVKEMRDEARIMMEELKKMTTWDMSEELKDSEAIKNADLKHKSEAVKRAKTDKRWGPEPHVATPMPPGWDPRHNIWDPVVEERQQGNETPFRGHGEIPKATYPHPNEIKPVIEQKDEPGKRYDAGKPRYDLLPSDSLHELVMVYTKGAEKYADRNWEKGMSWSRCFGSLMRHSWAFWRGETYDKETGCHHMAQVAWNALALCSYNLRGIGPDDRPRHDQLKREQA